MCLIEKLITKKDRRYLKDKAEVFKKWYIARKVMTRVLLVTKGVYAPKSVAEPGWRDAYYMMPPRIFWYEQNIDKLTRKIAFLSEARKVVRKGTEKEMDKLISKYKKKLQRFNTAHDRCVSSLYKEVIKR